MFKHGDEDEDKCQLECVKTPRIRNFVGPVKIILVDPTPEDYTRKIWGSAFVALANLLMAATVMTIFYFTLIFKLPMHINGHIAACTIGYQLLIPSGIMMLNPLFGGASHLKHSYRRTQHIFLQHTGVGSALGGAVFVLLLGKIKLNAHVVSGLLALATTIVAVILGPLVYFAECKSMTLKTLKYMHLVLGLTSFVISSVCMCTGLLTATFMKWSDIMLLKELPYLLYVFCFVYTVIIILSVYWKFQLKT